MIFEREIIKDYLQQTLIKYHQYEYLTKGAYGMLFKAFRKRDNLPVAIKVVQKSKLSDILIKLHMDEIVILDKFMDKQNTRIVQCFEAFEMEDYIVSLQEFCHLNLDQFVNILTQRGYQLKGTHITFLLQEIAMGLYHLHANQIIHRDLKLDNIMMKLKDQEILKKFFQEKQITDDLIEQFIKNCEIRLIDLGVSKSEGKKNGTQAGTTTTMSPEIKNGEEYGLSSDIYSLGICMYKIFFGEYPKENDQPQQQFQIYSRKRREMKKIFSLCQKMLLDPKERPTARFIHDSMQTTKDQKISKICLIPQEDEININFQQRRLKGEEKVQKIIQEEIDEQESDNVTYASSPQISSGDREEDFDGKIAQESEFTPLQNARITCLPLSEENKQQEERFFQQFAQEQSTDSFQYDVKHENGNQMVDVNASQKSSQPQSQNSSISQLPISLLQNDQRNGFQDDDQSILQEQSQQNETQNDQALQSPPSEQEQQITQQSLVTDLKQTDEVQMDPIRPQQQEGDQIKLNSNEDSEQNKSENGQALSYTNIQESQRSLELLDDQIQQDSNRPQSFQELQIESMEEQQESQQNQNWYENSLCLQSKLFVNDLSQQVIENHFQRNIQKEELEQQPIDIVQVY